jgi:hypothetical protein
MTGIMRWVSGSAWLSQRTVVLLALLLVLAPDGVAVAQGVTTGALAGTVSDAQQQPVAGATIIAIHVPSGTSYETVTRPDGRFSIIGMRVGGPYSVTVTYVEGGSAAVAFAPVTHDGVVVNLGVATDLRFVVQPITLQEAITVTAESDVIISSSRTGAATAVSREELAQLPTISGRLNDLVRLTPQASGTGLNFAGQDNRMNNITVDGSTFNNSFGLGGAPGERTGVAPISLEAIEQVQINVAPFDVRQGSFIGAGVNTVTRSGTNQFSATVYHRFRSQDWVGTEANGLAVNPGTFKFRNTGVSGAGPIVPNKLFVFGNYEDESDTRPISTFRANAGGETASGSVTRVLASDLNQLSSFLGSNFDYETGPFENIDDATPARRFLLRTDYNLNTTHKVSFRYTHLNSDTDVLLSGSSSLGIGRQSGTSTNFLSYQNSNYKILENIRSGVGEWNSVIGTTMSNSLMVGYTTQDESRASRGDFFPFVDVLAAAGGTAYTSFGFEPFTPNNELRYKTFQIQDNLTKFTANHSFTFGASAERYESENVFFPGSQSAYVYNSLADFFTDANDFLANPGRTTSPVTLRRFQVRYNNIPGQEKPIQPLEVWYGGAYAQDEWRPSANVTLTMGLRFDVPVFGDTAYANPAVDALTFRDENGAPVQYSTGDLPDPKILWSPRAGFNWDVNGNQRTQVRGGTGIFTGRPAYVWISNQIGNTGVLTGFIQEDNTTARPFNPDPNHYKPTDVTGAPAASVDLNVTDPDFKFPQLWRNNIAIDQRLPWGFTGTAEFMYSRDMNGIYYINANLPAAQSAFVGADNRARWTGIPCNATSGPCVTRINNAPGNNVTQAIVLKNQNEGRSWNIATSLSRVTGGLTLKGAYSYGETKNTVDAGSTAITSWGGNEHSGDPNNPGLAYSDHSPGHRAFVMASYTGQYFGFGATTISGFWEARHSIVNFANNSSYVFSGDMNGDTQNGNDLIYIPRDISEMNFQQFTHSNGRVFTAAEQAAAFEAYIQQDSYMRNRRGQYAERGGLFLPMVRRLDLSVTQDIFADLGGKRHSFQIRADFINFGNLLNDKWGVGQRVVQNQILTSPGIDAAGRSTYRLAVVNNELVNKSFESTTSTTTNNSDVYQFMLSLRYSFN